MQSSDLTFSYFNFKRYCQVEFGQPNADSLTFQLLSTRLKWLLNSDKSNNISTVHCFRQWDKLSFSSKAANDNTVQGFSYQCLKYFTPRLAQPYTCPVSTIPSDFALLFNIKIFYPKMVILDGNPKIVTYQRYVGPTNLRKRVENGFAGVVEDQKTCKGKAFP